jgi:hypothetical protein
VAGATVEASVAAGEGPDRDAVVMAFGDVVVGRLKGIAKALYAGGRFVAVEDGVAVFALDNAPTRDRAEQYRAEVEALLAEHFARAVPMRLVSEQEVGRAAPDPGTPRAAAAPGGSAARSAGGERPRARAAAPESSSAERPDPGARRPPPPPPRARRESPSAPPAGREGSGGPSVGRSDARRTGTPDPAEVAVAVAEPELDDEIVVDLSELEDAADVATSGLDKLTAAFPGSELIEDGGDG